MRGSGVDYLNRTSDVGREMTKERGMMKRTVASNIPRYFIYLGYSSLYELYPALSYFTSLNPQLIAG
jgi:hypothetical protein